MEKGPLLASPARVGKSTAAARARRWQLLGFAAFTSSCFSGTLIGWAGVTAALQSDAPGGGGLSEDEARRLFFYSSSVSMAASIPAGLVLDILGPRACFCAANALCALGLGLFSLGPHMAGLITFAVGSIGQMSSVMHVAALFAPHEATVVAVLGGTFSVSLLVLPTVGWLFDAGVGDVKAAFGVLAAIAAGCAVVGAAVWPDVPFRAAAAAASAAAEGEEEDEEDGGKEAAGRAEAAGCASGGTASGLLTALREAGDQMRTPAYAELLLFMVVPTLWMQTFFIGTLGEQLGDQGFVQSSQPYVNAYNILAPAMVLTNGVFGWVVSKRGSAAGVLAVTLVCALSCALLLLRSGGAFMVAEVANALGRCWLFAYFYTRVFAFGSNYGVLVAWPQVTLGLCGFAFEPLAAWAKGTCHVDGSDPLTCSRGHWHMLNWVQLVCVVGACANHLAGERRRARQQEGNNR